MMNGCPAGHEEWFKRIIDDMEIRVNSAKRLLEEIKDLSMLDNVEKCLSELRSLSDDLY